MGTYPACWLPNSGYLGHSGLSDVWGMINVDGSQNIETAVPAVPDIVMTTLKEELE